MEPARCDYIIVGLGLAGTALAAHLLALNRSVAVIHSETLHSSSRVAAGLFNPVTGRKMVKTWKADVLFPYLLEFYRKMEDVTGKQFLHARPIYRPFISTDEQNDWSGKSVADEYRAYIKDVMCSSQLPWVNDPVGGIVLDRCGYLETGLYLDAMHTYIREQCHLLDEVFNPELLDTQKDYITYQGIQARKIVFCEGTHVRKNPWFNWLPFRPVKGELLEISLDKSTDWIVNRGVFLFLTGEGRFRVGSTYDNKDTSWEPTSKGKDIIREKVSQLVTAPFKIEDHFAGIRPASPDRRPIVGIHPEKETFVIMNGLGTKGVSLAPFYAQQLAGYLEGNNALDSEVNISRYFSLY